MPGAAEGRARVSTTFSGAGSVQLVSGLLPFSVAHATNSPMRGGWVYIMTNRPNGTLYILALQAIFRAVHGNTAQDWSRASPSSMA